MAQPAGSRVGRVSWYLAIASGDVAGVTDVVPGLTGHPARTITDVVRRRSSPIALTVRPSVGASG
jgi:hypothetical protein